MNKSDLWSKVWKQGCSEEKDDSERRGGIEASGESVEKGMLGCR